MLNRVGATAKAVSTQWTAVGGGAAKVISINSNEDVADVNMYPAFTEAGEIYPLFVGAGAANSPLAGYDCVGTVQCNHIFEDKSWEAIIILFSGESETAVETEFYQARLNSQTPSFDGWSKMNPNTPIAEVGNFSTAYSNFRLGSYPSGTVIPFISTAMAGSRPFTDQTDYGYDGFFLVLQGVGIATKKILYVAYEMASIIDPGRMAWAEVTSTAPTTVNWHKMGVQNSPVLWNGEIALSNSTSYKSIYLSGYKSGGGKLMIEYAYLGGAGEGHMMGFSNGCTFIYDPADGTFTTSFYALQTSSGKAEQHEVEIKVYMSGNTLYIRAQNVTTGGYDLASQFRIKGVTQIRK